MLDSRRHFTLLPFRDVDQTQATRVSRTRFQIRSCERCGGLTTLELPCAECLARSARPE